MKRQEFTLRVRILGWAQQQSTPGGLYKFVDATPQLITLSINGKLVPYTLDHGYAVLKSRWQKGDQVTLSLPMQTEKVVASAQVKDDLGKFALQRGSVVYCLEGPANGLVQNITVDQKAPVEVVY